MPFKKGHRGRGRPPKSYASTRTDNPMSLHDLKSLGANDQATGTSTPLVAQDVSDEDMIDAEPDVEVEDARDGTPQDDVDEEEDAATPTQDDDDDDEEDEQPEITTIPRRRRGRGGGGARLSLRADYNTPDPAGDDGSEGGTPFKRRRGRPAGSGTGRGGFRGRRKGAQPEAPHVFFEGQKIEVVNDEAQIDDDSDGNEKVDENGLLQGGREYRVRTFKIIGRGDRLYMLSTEPARCCGFRDSYLFFTKHPKLYKLLLGEAEKKDLIDREILPNSYKGRNIGVVTARSVFREFGARIIVGGRRVTDDYKVAEVRAEGIVEGELADPEDRVPGKDEEYNRNRYVAWFGASDVYRSQGGGGQGPERKSAIPGKRRNNVSIVNWQHLHAREASRFNSSLAASRQATHDGVYDSNTNSMFYPTITQPTHARWEQIPPSSTADRQALTNGNHDQLGIDQQSHDTIFKPIPDVVSRNFTVIDTAFIAPPISSIGFPGEDGNVTDPTSGSTGLASIPAELVDELPEDCRRAFEEAKRTEVQWKQQWRTEKQSALRCDLKVGFVGYPV